MLKKLLYSWFSISRVGTNSALLNDGIANFCHPFRGAIPTKGMSPHVQAIGGTNSCFHPLCWQVVTFWSDEISHDWILGLVNSHRASLPINIDSQLTILHLTAGLIQLYIPLCLNIFS